MCAHTWPSLLFVSMSSASSSSSSFSLLFAREERPLQLMRKMTEKPSHARDAFVGERDIPRGPVGQQQTLVLLEHSRNERANVNQGEWLNRIPPSFSSIFFWIFSNHIKRYLDIFNHWNGSIPPPLLAFFYRSMGFKLDGKTELCCIQINSQISSYLLGFLFRTSQQMRWKASLQGSSNESGGENSC